MTIALKILVRLVVLTVILVAGFAAIDASGSIDPLGPGLLLFLGLFVVAFVWGIVDGARDGVWSLATWAATSAGTGVILEVYIAATVSDVSTSVGSVLESMGFMLLLMGTPALIGVGIGTLVRALRKPKPEPAQVS